MINDGADSKINDNIPDTILKSIPDKYIEYNIGFINQYKFLCLKVFPNAYDSQLWGSGYVM